MLDRILEHHELHATVFTFDGILKGKQIYLEEEKRSLLERLGVERENIYCMGDEGNDISMLRAAAQGFAPANCIPAIREEGFTIVSHAGKGAAADVVEILDRKY